MPVEMVVDKFYTSPTWPYRILFLREAKGERSLPMVIGNPEAEAIASKLHNAVVPRPLTHDLLCNVMRALGGRVTHILINDLDRDIYYARIVLDVDGRHVEIDSRPSDAIAVAVRVNVPIFMEESVLERAADRPRDASPGNEETIGEEQLGAFRDVINKLDLDDLGGRA